MIWWRAGNNSTVMYGFRTCASVLQAVRAARHYIRNELYGEGIVEYFDTNPDDYDVAPFRREERSIFTNFKWKELL